MKPLLKSALPLLLLALLYGSPMQAQVQVNVNVGAPAWGPPVGPGVQYYYIPEIDGYYDLYTQSYVYFDPYYNTWVSAPALPAAYYAGYDPRYFHPVVVQYVGRQPWGLIYDHRGYCNSRGWRPGYYRSAPGPRWQGGYGGYGYRSQNGGRYDNQPYAHNGPGRGGYQGGNSQGGRYDNDDRRGGGYDGRRDQPNGGGRPDYGQGQPGRGQGGFGGNGNGNPGNNGHGGGRGRVR
ncbi:hypothetical protein [Hymenobacter jeollabukensis]|uniref:DUF3300 domain-containing protein n=1 Tax=Hymenobacter jeollabukensis TaxID=2025313 RepID=A0A5R8WU30_9BACT|nr:hypothetical protein [Hymenobacter jeollabukensis]TLM95282.1 hypothetical protein FDY95_05705 [Hymenobacter jeollabukensis]